MCHYNTPPPKQGDLDQPPLERGISGVSKSTPPPSLTQATDPVSWVVEGAAFRMWVGMGVITPLLTPQNRGTREGVKRQFYW